MDNNIEKSYFIYKANAKIIIKERFKTIEKCERKISKIKAGEYGSGDPSFDKPYNDQAIEFFNNVIEKQKRKIQKKINKICHG